VRVVFPAGDLAQSTGEGENRGGAPASAGAGAVRRAQTVAAAGGAGGGGAFDGTRHGERGWRRRGGVPSSVRRMVPRASSRLEGNPL
jgi:hypothetical protein